MSKNTVLTKALQLEYITIAWNICEGFLSVCIGLITGSVALIAYGLESSIEVFASSVTVWELKGSNKKREKQALRLIGYAYLLVSVYIFFDAFKSLLDNHHPERSYLGILLMIVTASIMLWLGIAKKRVGKKLNSQTVLADSKFTLIDAVLSITVLIGLALNTLFGWWWADQVMAIFLAIVAFQEGVKEII